MSTPDRASDNDDFDMQNLKKQNLLGMVLSLIDQNKTLQDEADGNTLKMCTIMRQNRDYKVKIDSYKAKNQELLDLIEHQQALLAKAKRVLEEKKITEKRNQPKQELEDGEIPDSEPETNLNRKQQKKLRKKLLKKLEKTKKRPNTRGKVTLLRLFYENQKKI